MKTIIHYLTVPAMIALFLFWKLGDSVGAGNVFQVLFWFIYPLAAMVMFFCLGTVEEMTDESVALYKKSPWFSRTVALCMFAVTAWFGHHFMAALALLNIVLGATLRYKVLERFNQHKTA